MAINITENGVVKYENEPNVNCDDARNRWTDDV